MDRCETCLYFRTRRLSLDLSYFECEHSDLARPGFGLLEPPSPDFGCTLHAPKEADNGEQA